MDSAHKPQLVAQEDGLFGVCRRVEHINGSGVRVLDRSKCDAHWDTVREVFDKKQRHALRSITKAILAEAMVIIGKEDEALKSNHKLMKQKLAEME